LATLALLLTYWSPVVLAQGETAAGTVNGSVSDPAGAAVPNAKVTLRNTDTGFSRTMNSTEAGLFHFTTPGGAYELSVQAQGFKTSVQKEIPLTVGGVVTIDLRLEIGVTTDTVTVSAESPVIETSRSSSSATVDSQSIGNLPLNGRSFIDLTV